MDPSDDEFSDHGSGAELIDERLLPDPDGMARRTRSRRNRNQNEMKTSSGAYAWEDEYQRTWDIVKEDEQGTKSLESLVQQMIEARKKKIMKNPTTPFQRGIIRTLILVIDGSLTMLEKDLRPTRFSVMISYLLDFVVEFFDQNPISQLGVVMMRNGMAHLVSEVSGLPQYHLDKLRGLNARLNNRFEPKGDPSLQNALELARSLLTANFGGMAAGSSKNSKEVLIIFGALFTSDPGDIHRTIDNLVKDEVKVKVIGLSARVAICQELVNRTNFLSNGKTRTKADISNYYGVILNESHFKELLMDCVEPLAVTTKSAEAEKETSHGVPLIRMGFPLKMLPNIGSTNNAVVSNFPKLCACHTTQGSTESQPVVTVQNGHSSSANLSSVVGYRCPQCSSRVCHLPSTCPVCGLMLILSTHLARSYHHLVPLGDFKEVEVSPSYTSTHCFGCLLRFPEGSEGETALLTSSRYRCGKCHNDFCIDCDVFVHETLHNCPGCENKSHL